MPRFIRPILPALLLLCSLALPALAQDKGSISGKVIDKRTGHALPFASVTVPDAKRGGMTDSEGQFLVTGVAPGTYEVKVQFLGYEPASQPGVVVVANKATVVNFQMKDIVVRQEKEVQVTAERRLVEAKQGSTIRSVNAQEIRNLPVQTIGEVLQQQAGINVDADQVHVRGGRADETVFMVNGVTNRDLVTGQSTAGQLNARSVAEVNVATGAFDVKYGNALSGIVDIKLKEGTDQFQGGLTTTGGTWGGRAAQLVIGGPAPLLSSVMKNVYALVDVSATLFDTRFRYLDAGTGDFFARISNSDLSSPSFPALRSSYEDKIFGKTFKYGSFWSPSEDNRWSGRYAMTWKPNNTDKLNLSFSKAIAIDQGFSRTLINAAGDEGDPAYPWIWAHRIDHANTIFEDNVQSSLDWRRTLGLGGFTEAQVSRFYSAQRRDVQGKMWPDFVQPYDLALPDSSKHQDYWYDTGDDNTWQDRRTDVWALTWTMLQRFRPNELEFGLEHQFQDVQYLTIENPWVYDKDGLGDSHDLWNVHPMVGDLFVRDKLDYEGFTANVGLRFDYWFLGREVEQAMADTSNKNLGPDTRAQFYEDTRSFFGRRYKLKISPRVIVAFPITENSSFFFNYGQFTQNPSYRYVYSKLTSISSESFPLLGNPNLNPQTSINYEVGAKHQFMRTAAVNASVFVKDVYDYPTATTVKRQSGESLSDVLVYLNGHFARSKGFEVELEKRRAKYWSGKISYTYQQTKGKSSDPNEAKLVQEAGGDAAETRLSETFVRWNRPHKLAVNFDLRFDKEAPMSFLHQWGLNLYVQGQSGRAYTPDFVAEQTLPSGRVVLYRVPQSAEPFSKNAKFQITTDMKIDKWFLIAGNKLDFSLQGLNIFNNYLINRVDPITGNKRIAGVGSYDPRLVEDYPTSDAYQFALDRDVYDPSNLGPGSQWRFSLDYDF